ncbi:MAG: hypothetical protein LBD51_10140 [Bifidobacteriaceae bacterium]|jgi:hypothetical protein|nr:hypothetical protein [Bifidobacteriaceae bacterium]
MTGPDRPAGRRKLAAATMAVLAVGLATALFAVGKGVSEVRAAAGDAALATTLRACDAALAALTGELAGADAAETDQAFEAVARAGASLDLERLDAGPEALQLLRDAPGALAGARAKGSAQGSAPALRAAATALAGALADRALAQAASRYAAQSSAGATGGAPDPDLAEVAAAAESLLSAARARLLVAALAAGAALAARALLAWRLAKQGGLPWRRARPAAPPAPASPDPAAQPPRAPDPAAPPPAPDPPPPPPAAPPGHLPLANLLREALAQVERPQLVRWTLASAATVPPEQAAPLARLVAQVVNAACARAPGAAVLVKAESTAAGLDITVSDAVDGPQRGQIPLGPAPRAAEALVRSLGATLAAVPGRSGHGTDTSLRLPLGAGMH